MGAPVVKSTNGYGLPVTVVDKGGLPVSLASNGFGTPVIEIATGGLPVTYDGAPVGVLDFANDNYQGVADFASAATFARATSATDLEWDSPAGYAYQTWTSGQPRLKSGKGLFYENVAATNLLTNPAAPADQTTVSLTAGQTYTLWMNGNGSVSIASSGTAVIRCQKQAIFGQHWVRFLDNGPVGVATQGVPVRISVDTSGTCAITITGNVNQFQLETGFRPTSFIIGTRNAETCSWLSGTPHYLACAGANGTVSVKARTTASASAFGGIIKIGNNNPIAINNFDGGMFSSDDQGGNAFYNTCGTGRTSSTFIACVSWDPNKRILMANGSLASVGTKLKATGASGSGLASSGGWCGWISNVKFWNTTLMPPAMDTVTRDGLGFPTSSLYWPGDSLVERAEGYSNAWQTSAPQWLAQYASIPGVVNGGQGGDLPSGLKYRYSISPHAWNKPIVILIGWNVLSQATSQALADTLILQPIADTVAMNTSGKVLVCGLVNGSTAQESSGGTRYAIIQYVNAQLAATYGANFLDLKTALNAMGNPAYPADVTDLANDRLPSSLRLRSVNYLRADIDAAATSFTLDAAQTAGATYMYLPEPQEAIKANTVSGTTVTSASRAQGGSTAAAHKARVDAVFNNDADVIHFSETGHQAVAQLVADKIGPSGLNWALAA